jgi:hypothetical protein
MTWHYPNPTWPSSAPWVRAARINTCPTCGAPPGAQCVSKTGRLFDGNHLDRASNAGTTPLTNVEADCDPRLFSFDHRDAKGKP